MNRVLFRATLAVAVFVLGCASNPASEGDGGAETGTNTGQVVCELRAGTAPTGDARCAAAEVGLSADTCRCGARWYWNGTSCVETAACMCTRACELLFETEAQCQSAYEGCPER